MKARSKRRERIRFFSRESQINDKMNIKINTKKNLILIFWGSILTNQEIHDNLCYIVEVTR